MIAGQRIERWAICKISDVDHGEVMSSAQSLSGERPASDRWVRASTPEDAAAIAALMRDAGLQAETRIAHLHWKYWRPREDWSGSRSFVLTDGRELLAHGAVMPGTLAWGSVRARVIHMIDWAARREALGAGIQLMKHVARETDFLLGIGGSPDTLKIMPLLQYRLSGTVRGYARPLSPLGVLNDSSRSRWKMAPRVARSLFWAATAPRPDLSGWQPRRADLDDVVRICSSLSIRRSVAPVLERGPALLRHALACPIVPVELYLMEKGGRAGGHFVLSFVPGQARLADLWMESEDPADWRALVHSAVQQAKAKSGVVEVVAWSSDPLVSKALEHCGFHQRFTLPIYVRSSGTVAMPPAEVRVHMLDNDAFYLHSGRSEFWA